MMKTLTAFATAGAIAAAAVAVPASAEARSWHHHGGNGGAVAAGVVGGLAAGAIIGSAVAPSYGYGYYAADPAYYGGSYAYSRCYLTRQKVWTDYGPRWRRVRVCD